MRIVEKMPAVTEKLPPCSIRRDCRWWKQEGKATCMHCPQVITEFVAVCTPFKPRM